MLCLNGLVGGTLTIIVVEIGRQLTGTVTHNAVETDAQHVCPSLFTVGSATGPTTGRNGGAVEGNVVLITESIEGRGNDLFVSGTVSGVVSDLNGLQVGAVVQMGLQGSGIGLAHNVHLHHGVLNICLSNGVVGVGSVPCRCRSICPCVNGAGTLRDLEICVI